MSARSVESEVLPQAVAKLDTLAYSSADWKVFTSLSWAHNVILIQKLKDLPTRYWYARQALEQGWSRDTLIVQIKNRAHERQGTAITNFATALPEAHAAIAQGLLKDPYLFDFLTLEEPFHERELETGLVQHIQHFLLELGRGFAFVGRQYHIEISERDFYLDLLFYHLHLRCFVVVDLKKGEFKPEYAGKMNFYCSAVDDLLRHEHDAPTIGLILCQTKDQVFAEYALRDVQKPIGLAEYELTRALPKELASSLPSIEAIETELADERLKEDEQ
jgi:predicted nuclease of restriction endonuclease-like (RecB) superfamily